MSIQTFVKGDQVRLVRTAREAVQAEWEGYRRADQADVDVDYSALQARAKELGIPANQSKAKLADAVANFVPKNADPEVPETHDHS